MASIINASTTSTAGLVQTADASGVLQLQTNGVTGLTVEANAAVTMSSNLFVSGSRVQPLVAGTAQATTSGTSIPFTGIPSWVKRIQIGFNGISSNGTSQHLVQLGTSSGYEVTGYTSTSLILATSPGTNNNGANYTTGYGIFIDNITYTYSGVFTLLNISGNVWSGSYVFGMTSVSPSVYTGLTLYGGGTKTLSGVLTSLRLTTVNGTDAFDAGSMNIFYD